MERINEVSSRRRQLGRITEIQEYEAERIALVIIPSWSVGAERVSISLEDLEAAGIIPEVDMRFILWGDLAAETVDDVRPSDYEALSQEVLDSIGNMSDEQWIETHREKHNDGGKNE